MTVSSGWNLRFAFLYGSCALNAFYNILCGDVLHVCSGIAVRPSTMNDVDHVLTLTS